MVHQALAAAGQHIYRRFAEDEPERYNLPRWAPAVFVADFVIFLPIFVLIIYTFGGVIPTLAIVEDPNPPAYEPVALDEGAADQGPVVPGKPITSSLRATRRLLASIDGWRSYFRGFVPFLVFAAANSTIGGIVNSAIPFIPLGNLVAPLALTQLLTGLTHIIITVPSELRFYQRLPPFKKTFEATCFPIFAIWASEAVTILAVGLVHRLLGIKLTAPDGGAPQFDGHDAWKGLIVFLVASFFYLALVIPANVMLVRVQATLLGSDEQVIVPFDRSFGGKLEPAIVGGKGYLTLREALMSFPRESWVRLYKLYAKIVGIIVATYFGMAAIIVPEVLLILAMSKKA
ncbi:hypothetical protein QBC39DRAFT_338214 [Podospora conica]|nr:hypothetical protein QBC39DRAFT_338214 [Schizothecium conicum]